MPDESGRSRPPDASGVVTARRAAGLALAFLALSLPALVFRGSVRAAAALHEHAATPGWLAPAEWLLVWAAAPLAIVGAIVLVLLPGLLLALAIDRGRSVEEWVLHGFALSLVLVSVTTAIAQRAAGVPIRGGAFVAVVLGSALPGALLLLRRVRRGPAPSWPFAAPAGVATAAGMLVVPFALLVVLAPKFYWEAFNGDGAHAFEVARLLLHRSVPFWDAAAGPVAAFPGITSFTFAYPVSWFIRLFGEIEVAARAPYLLFLVALAGGIMALANAARPGVLRAADRWLVWLALVGYTLVVAFSTTYEPYSADLALPATQDTLLMVGFLGFVLAFAQRAWGWAAGYALLTYLSLPNGLLLLGFWALARLVVERPFRWRLAVAGGAMVAGSMVVGAMLPPLLRALGAASPGGEYSALHLLLRFAYLQVTDWTRLAYLIVPGGIVPAFALLAWRRQDPLGRALTLVTVAYFLVAFVQLRSPLHYYIPAMLLPLVVFWRLVPDDGGRRAWQLATAAGGVLAIALAMPTSFAPYVATRTIGRAIDHRVGGYGRMVPAPFRSIAVMQEVIPYTWDPRVPEETFGGSAIAIAHYAHGSGPREATAYVVQRDTAPPPAAGSPVAIDNGFAMYVVDSAAWARHLAMRPPPAGAPLFRQARGILFRTEPLEDGPFVIDLPAIAEELGVDVDGLARRAGVVVDED